MSPHYNAFISYRHAPLDTKVASEVQRQLERFHIPKAIQKQSGMKRIDRIFRDKEELTITSDLNETIENALNNSDFLIVICSHSTKESAWVLREIQFFLKTHDRKHILTVVAEGEPCDVVPEILQYQEMELPTEDGNVESVRVPVEPLSCDYRGNFKKARKEELPRLAAALLGCSYDDLRQRQRQYRNRRIAAAVSALGIALTGLAAYYAWSAARIQENYEQALRNQSEYLASESQKLLDSGDRLSAMLLAIEALPSEENDRPVVASAVNALAEATYAYVPEGFGEASLVSSFDHEGEINDYFWNDDLTKLYVLHSLRNVTVWDFENHTQLFSRRFDNSTHYIALTQEENLLILSGYDLICLENGTWEELWRTEFETSVYGSNVLCIPGTDRLAMSFQNQILVLDSATGEILSEHFVPDGVEEDTAFLKNLTVSDNGRYCAGAAEYDDGGRIAVLDLETGELAMSQDVVFDYFSEVYVADDGTAVLMGNTYAGMETGYTYYTKGVSYYHLKPGYTTAFCMNPDGITRWTSEMEYAMQYSGYQLKLITYPASETSTNLITDKYGDTGIAAMLCSAGECAQIIDLTTGEILEQVSFTAPIIDTYWSLSAILPVLSDGHMALYSYDDKTQVNMDYFMQGVEQCEMSKGSFLVSQVDSSSILHYMFDQYDQNWTLLDDPENCFDSEYETLYTDTGILMTNSKNEMRYYDAVTESLLWSIPLEDRASYYTLVGIDQQQKYAYATLSSLGYAGCQLLKIDLSTGEYTQEPIPCYSGVDDAVLQNGILYYVDSLNLEEIAQILDLDPDVISTLLDDPKVSELADGSKIVALDIESMSILSEISFDDSIDSMQVSTDGSRFLIRAQDGAYHVLGNGIDYEMSTVQAGSADLSQYADEANLLAGNKEDLSQLYNLMSLSYTPVTALSADASRIALADESYIYVFNGEFQLQQKIFCNAMSVVAMHFYADQLLVAYGNQGLYRYDINTGEYLGKTETYCENGYGGPERWDFSQEGKLALHIDYDLSIIDLETWQVETYLDNCMGYCPSVEKVFVAGWASNDNLDYYCMGLFHVYDYKELIQKAQGLLDGLELTQDQKNAYGID